MTGRRQTDQNWLPLRPRLISASGLCLAFLSSGCAMMMADHGHPEPQFDKIAIGAARETVEQEFGAPIASRRLPDGTEEKTYRYEMGNAPDPERARVYLYAYLSIAGLLGEPIYSLREFMEGSEEETKILYGQDRRVLGISGYHLGLQAAVLPPDGPSQAGEPSLEEGATPLPPEVGETIPPEALSVLQEVKALARRLSASIKERGIARIAVLPVQDLSGKDGRTLGTYLTEKLTATLHEEKAARIVERSRLAAVTNEIALSYSGPFDENSVARLGKLLGTEAVVTTSYVALGPSTIEMNSAVVSVETAEVLGVGSAALPRSALEPMLQ